MKIVIAGSRDFNNYDILNKCMTSLLSGVLDRTMGNGEITIISGGARGADVLGERYAKEHNMILKVFPAEWDKYGKSAGYKRNHQMAQYGDVLVAFWDRQSRGTMHMINLCKQLGLQVYVFDFNGNQLN